MIAVGVAAMTGGLPLGLGSILGSVMLGNVTLLLAAAVVAGSAWSAFPLFTKLGPAVVGLWPVARGDWRAVRRMVLVCGTVFAVSFALAPSLWTEWAAFVLRTWNEPPTVPVVAVPWSVRFVVAAAIVLLAARTNRRWLLPIAAGLAVPALYGWTAMLPYAIGVVALRSPIGLSTGVREPRKMQGPQVAAPVPLA